MPNPFWRPARLHVRFSPDDNAVRCLLVAVSNGINYADENEGTAKAEPAYMWPKTHAPRTSFCPHASPTIDHYSTSDREYRDRPQRVLRFTQLTSARTPAASLGRVFGSSRVGLSQRLNTSTADLWRNAPEQISKLAQILVVARTHPACSRRWEFQIV
jgi:hypothetical protein